MTHSGWRRVGRWAGHGRVGTASCCNVFLLSSLSLPRRERESRARGRTLSTQRTGAPVRGTFSWNIGVLSRFEEGWVGCVGRGKQKNEEKGEGGRDRASARACSRLSLPPTSRPGDQARTASSAFRTRRHTPRPSRAASTVVQSQAAPQPTSGRTHGGTPSHKRERELEGVAAWAASACPPPPSRLASARLSLRRGRQRAADAAGEAWRGAAPAADGSALAAGGGHGWPRASLVRTRPSGPGRSHVRRQIGASSTAFLRARAQHVFLFTDTQTTKK